MIIAQIFPLTLRSSVLQQYAQNNKMSQMQSKLSEEILKEFECPICMEVIKTSQIFQCDKGHMVFKECCPEFHHCSECFLGFAKVCQISRN